jgi:hypothetical protein
VTPWQQQLLLQPAWQLPRQWLVLGCPCCCCWGKVPTQQMLLLANSCSCTPLSVLSHAITSDALQDKVNDKQQAKRCLEDRQQPV